MAHDRPQGTFGALPCYALLHWRALHIGPDDQRAGVEFSQVSDGRVGAGIRKPSQTATYEHLFDLLVGAGEQVGGMARKRLPGLPTTVIVFEPSVGLPTSADGPHPRREGFDDGRLRTMGHRDEIKPVAGQSERMRLHELPAP